jgi:hypothetical protein
MPISVSAPKNRVEESSELMPVNLETHLKIIRANEDEMKAHQDFFEHL